MSDDIFEEHDPYKKTSLESLLREYTDDDLQKEGDTHLLVKKKMEHLTLHIWDLAMENAREGDTKTIDEQDVIDAFNELFYPYTILEEAAVTMGEYEKEFRRTAADAKLTDIEERNRDDS